MTIYKYGIPSYHYPVIKLPKYTETIEANTREEMLEQLRKLLKQLEAEEE